METTRSGSGDDDPAGVPPSESLRGPATDIDFRIVAEKSLSLIVVTNPSGAIQYVNPMFCWYTGLAADEITGCMVQDLGQLNPTTVAELWNTLRMGEPWRGEVAARTEDGREFWLHSSISPITDGSGRVTHFIAVSLDISERKRAEQALSESEERFRGLAETTTAATFVFDGPRIRYANRAASEITGYATDELVGKNFWELAHPEVERITAEQLASTPPGGQVTSRAEIALITKGGETRWLDLSMGFVELEGKRLVLGTGFDITERRQAQQALRDTEERYRLLYQHNPVMYFTLSGDLSVIAVNQHGAERLGYSPEELVGQPFSLVVHGDDRAQVRWQLESLVRRGGEEEGLEFRKARKDGGVIWVRESARVTRDTDGEGIILLVSEDISERKRMEETLQALRQDLERRAQRSIAGKNPYVLSFRELTVLHLVAQGRSDKEIASVLGIRRQTVSKHVANLLRKMEASSRTEAGVRALREGLIR